MRFVSVQLEAMLQDDLWLASGARANALATHLAGALKQVAGIEIAYPVETNMVFARMPVEKAARMRAGGAQFYDWFPPQKDGTVVTRIALAFATPDEHVVKLIELAKAK